MEWITKWWIEAAFGIVLAILALCYRWLVKKVKTLIKEQTASNNGTKALLRDRIIQAYNHYKDEGECPIYARDNVQALYKEYTALGGNGTVSGLVAELMKLPTEKQHREAKE